MKGEEYRLTGSGGWTWMSATRSTRYVPANTVGLRFVACQLDALCHQKDTINVPMPIMTNEDDHYTASNESGTNNAIEDLQCLDNVDQEKTATMNGDISNNKQEISAMIIDDASEIKSEDTAMLNDKTFSVKQEETASVNGEIPYGNSNAEQFGFVSVKQENTDTDCLEVNADVKTEDNRCALSSRYPDVIDITSALEERIYFPNVNKPFSKLDSLLDKRLRQEESEEKHRIAYNRILTNQQKQLRLRSQLENLTTKVEIKSVKLPTTAVESVSKATVNTTSADVNRGCFLSTSCYSSVCKADDFHIYKCYSPACALCKAIKTEADVTRSFADKSGTMVGVAESCKSENRPVIGKAVENSAVSTQANLSNGFCEEKVQYDIKCTTAIAALKACKADDDEPVYKIVLRGMTEREINNALIGLQDFNLLSMMEDGKVKLTDEIIKNMALKLCGVSSTKYFTSLKQLLQSRAVGKKRTAFKTGSIPPGHQFLTKSTKKRSILILEKMELRQVARIGGLKPISGFHYECKTSGSMWPHPCPRPMFRKTWEFHSQLVKNFSAIALQLHILWVCIAWEDMQVRNISR